MFYPFASLGAPELRAPERDQQRRAQRGRVSSVLGDSDTATNADEGAPGHEDLIRAATIQYKRQIDRQFMSTPAAAAAASSATESLGDNQSGASSSRSNKRSCTCPTLAVQSVPRPPR